MNDSWLALRGSSVERFLLRMIHIVENIFSTGTEDALCVRILFATEFQLH